MLTREQREKTLKTYLNSFFVKIDKKNLNMFKKITPLKSCIIVIGHGFFKQLCCYLLTNFGFQNYVYYDSDDLIHKLFGKSEDKSVNISEDVLIVSLFYTSYLNLNPYTKNLLLTQINKRVLIDKKTIIITDFNISENEEFRSLKLTIYNMYNKDIRSENTDKCVLSDKDVKNYICGADKTL